MFRNDLRSKLRAHNTDQYASLHVITVLRPTESLLCAHGHDVNKQKPFFQALSWQRHAPPSSPHVAVAVFSLNTPPPDVSAPASLAARYQRLSS